jgi:hypothetical protein
MPSGGAAEIIQGMIDLISRLKEKRNPGHPILQIELPF